MDIEEPNFENIYKQWNSTGKNEIIGLCKGYLDMCGGEMSYERNSQESKFFKNILYSMCLAAIKGHLKIDGVVETFIEITDICMEVPQLLADLFSSLEVELSCYEDNTDMQRFNNLVLASMNVVPDCLLKEKLDPEVLENLGIIQSKAAFQQKCVKAKTKLFYKQQKFNLLREESEGYSKLVTELSQDFPSKFSHTPVLHHIQSLIGCFNLDPNRVMDIILDVFECRPEKANIFIPLLTKYGVNNTALCHILVFRFKTHQDTPDEVTMPSLYHVTALLVQHNLIDLDVLIPHLTPSRSEILDKHKSEVAVANQSNQIQNICMEKTAADEKDEKNEKNNVDNQKLGVCEALLSLGCKDQALSIISLFPMYSAMIPSVAKVLCRLIHYIIDPLYVNHSGLSEKILKHRMVPSSFLCSVTQAKTFSDLVTMVFPLIKRLGPYLSCDPILLIKINRLAKSYMVQNNGSTMENYVQCDNFCHIMAVYDECMLPSLTLLTGNCSICEEIWGFLKLLNYEHRYRLYGRWKNESPLASLSIMKAQAEVLSSTKYIMKRLVKENAKQVGRQIGKLSHRAPGIVFEQILSQIQRHDNFIPHVVDGMKFISSMSFDVLAYTVIEALVSPDKERLKTDGSNISSWLQSLSKFCGLCLKKYQVDITGLLQYVINQLRDGRSSDLCVLAEVIQKMTGIEIPAEVTADQLLAMSGGDILKQEAGYFIQAKNTKKSSSRLLVCLNEQNLTIPFCILMAQQRNAIIFPKSDSEQAEPDMRHVKLIGNLYDQCQDTLVQFISFLSMQMTPEELKKKLPNLLQLSKDHYISPDVAFALWRRIFTSEIASKADAIKKSEKKDQNAMDEKPNKVLRYCEAAESVMESIRNDLVEPMMSPQLWEEISLQFFATFWSLDLYDLEVPTTVYEDQISKRQLEVNENNKTQSKNKKEKERCLFLIEKLNEEKRRQEEHVKMVLQRLLHERDQWFSMKHAKQSTITAILQHCLFPRCCFSDVDAIYCAKFLYLLHNLKTPNFASLICYDRIFADVVWMVSSCTENEAHRFGRFLNAILSNIMSWHSDKATYERECADYPGFMVIAKTKPSNQIAGIDRDFENFRHVVYKWHFCLARAVVNCLESNDYIQIRNMLIVLTKIVSNFPKISVFGNALARRVEKVIKQEKENRQDLYHLAFGYCSQLNNSKNSWVPDYLFHKKDSDNKSKNTEAPSPTHPMNNDGNTNSKEDGLRAKEPAITQTIPIDSKSPSNTIRNQFQTYNDQSAEKEPSKEIADMPKVDERQSCSRKRRSTDLSPQRHRAHEQPIKTQDKPNDSWQNEKRLSDVGTSESKKSKSSRAEGESKRRKVDANSGSKESVMHQESKERNQKSPKCEGHEKIAQNESRNDKHKERHDRKRQSGGISDFGGAEAREIKWSRADGKHSSQENSSRRHFIDDKRRGSQTKERRHFDGDRRYHPRNNGI